MILPSKELLSEVLNYNVNIIDDIADNEIIYNDGLRINIYKLQHLMKEWALEQGFHIKSSLKDCKINDDTFDVAIHTNFKSDTEFEAVVKACEYILNVKDKQ